MAGKTALEIVKATWQNMVDAGGLDAKILSELRVVDANHHEGVVTAEMRVEPHHLNRANGLHGGTICTLVDIAGSLAVSARKQTSGLTGVSTDIHVSFLNGGKLGDNLRIESFCPKVGRMLAFTTTKIFAGTKLLATGSHTKYVGNSVAGATASADDIYKTRTS
ncbi:hypothetical protein SeMB42_g00309 [Synchytrium endobioticum]|uniref:Thioesterase domain-containing protein n=1 Tax=Synchytrium endobioticum TaxID=286115 RepID=A0A507DRJ4_9FUNG|nr:hypothetical protein SeLEV6574_g00661 [Synchytrium endobioticum]TPX54333.1 hypothetical protein SeMB42_g00309 [Synchytrium endobioticum]